MAGLRSNGRLPEPEVIANFLDGNSYSKGKLEEAFRTLRLDRPYPKPAKAAPTSHKAEDIDLIVREFEVTRAQAEKILTQANGNIGDALQRLLAV
uniref:N/A n=1 Tax=Ganoderma boninense TaxID=34458 RepID=A0A5K1K3R6_9APHY|nr:N/A [Ganoderma boninense]